MKKSLLNLLKVVSITFLLSLWCTTYAADTLMNLQITPWDLSFGAPSPINFPDTKVMNTWQTVIITATGTYNAQSWWTANGYNVANNPDDYFWVEDLYWSADWYCATLQISWWLTAWSGKTISWTLVDAIVPWWTVTKLAWSSTTWVIVQSWAQNWSEIWTAPLTIMQRTVDIWWLVWKYWVLPSLRINIPEYQTLGSYSWTLVYTVQPGCN